MGEKKDLIIQRNDLLKAVSKMKNTVNKKYSHEITSNVNLIAKEDTLTIYATNFNIHQKTIIKTISSKNNHNFIINAVGLLKILSVLKDGEINIEEQDRYILIKQNKNKIEILKIISIFPQYLNRHNINKETHIVEKINIDHSKFLYITELIKHACAGQKDAQNFAVNGILIESNAEKINFVATDAKRLAYTSLNNDEQINLNVIIFKNTIEEVRNIFLNNYEIDSVEILNQIKQEENGINIEEHINDINNNENEKKGIKIKESINKQKNIKDSKECDFIGFDIYVLKNISGEVEMVGFENKTDEYYAKTINANFPNYKSIIKKYNSPAIKIPKDKMLEALKNIKEFSEDSYISIQKENITIKTPIDSDIKVNLIVEIENEVENEVLFRVTNSYMIDMLRSNNDSIIELFVDNTDRPFMLQNSEFIEIIMPQRL